MSAATLQLRGIESRLLALASLLPAVESPSARTGDEAGIRRRDPQQWRALYESERAPLYRYALSRLGSAEDAEDLVGQVFEAAWESAHRYEDRGLAPRAWLFGIARNLVLMRRRGLFRKPPPLALEAFDQPHSDSGMDASMIDLAAAIRSLPGDLAEVVTLRFLHGLTAPETAAVLDVPLSTVKGRQLRALERLRNALGDDNA